MNPTLIETDSDWLMFADWLEERGEWQRSELIRHQLEPVLPTWDFEHWLRGRGVGDGLDGGDVGADIGSGVGVIVKGVGAAGISVGGIGGSSSHIVGEPHYPLQSTL